MFSDDQLVILDADGTVIDAFAAIATTFSQHGMNLGDLERFQKRHNLFKYLGGAKEFPSNLKRQLSSARRSALLRTLTEVYREQARLYPGMGEMIGRLLDTPGVRLGLVTRNITNDPQQTLKALFEREGVAVERFDFLIHLPLKQSKLASFEQVRRRFAINPARGFVCGDEHKDFRAAVGAGLHPLIVSYGFENRQRLTGKFEVPEAVICATPAALSDRLCHALGLPVASPADIDSLSA